MTNLRRLFHSNLLNPLGDASEEYFLFVVYELMKNENLKHKFESKQSVFVFG